MADFGDQLQHWLQEVEKTSNLSIDEKTKITEAGAKVYAEKLREATPVSGLDYSGGKKHGRKSKHLRDSITYSAGYTADKVHGGDTTVGFEKGYASLVAGFVNNGVSRMSPKQIKNMHFKDKVDVEAKEAVFEAMAKKYKEVKGL